MKVGRRGKEGRESERAGACLYIYISGIKELEGSSGEHFHLKIRMCISPEGLESVGYSGCPV